MMSKESIEVLLKRFKKSNRIIGITTSLLVLLFAGMSLWDLFHGTKVFIETELSLVTTIVYFLYLTFLVALTSLVNC